MIRRRIRVVGQVQGVGFRPFVYRQAAARRLAGSIRNDAGVVTIDVQGPGGDVDDFLAGLRAQLPPLAHIDSLTIEPLPVVDADGGFVIAPSGGGEMTDAQVTVDTAVCADCLRELLDPADRRYRYPFINCTNCGPRYSIVRRVPYDRANTTMAGFAMCPACQREYDDPLDRRYHAQPVACPACGPRLWLADAAGEPIAASDPIAAAAALLRDGRIVAVKGLGGFQLAVRADDEPAVARLRARKNRQAKPLAIMVSDLPAARRLACLRDDDAELLTGPRGPIVLMPRLAGAAVAPSVAQGSDKLGIMLPTTPLHHLLMRELDCPLVMTSGNISEEPLARDNDEAVATLGDIADAMLLHDRPIERRVDDSVVMRDGRGKLVPVRRARGYAPAPLAVLELPQVAVLAAGGELKNTFCLYRGGRATVSEHIGDLKDGRSYRHYQDAIEHLRRLYEFAPQVVAFDLHPAYLSTGYARQLAQREGLELVAVQHHHAHAAAVLAEHGQRGPAIAIAADGAGHGDDGDTWGCEILLADVRSYRRIGHLLPMPLPGGDAAATQTDRPAIAMLQQTFGDGLDWSAVAARLASEPQRVAAIRQVAAMPSCPNTSSLGRVFDAAAALCGLARENRFEGEAPMALEAAADRDEAAAYAFELVDSPAGIVIDWRPMLRALWADLWAGAAVAAVAARWHNAIADFLAAAATHAARQQRLGTIVVAGGCFANGLMTARLVRRLEGEGLSVLSPRLLPCNDAALSLGQAVVAAASHTR